MKVNELMLYYTCFIIFVFFCIDLTYAQKSYIAQEAESHPELIPDLIEVLGFQKDDPKYKKFKGGTLVMRMLTDWEVSAHEKMEECPKRSNLARELLKKSKSVSRNAGLLLKLSKELDYQGKYFSLS